MGPCDMESVADFQRYYRGSLLPYTDETGATHAVSISGIDGNYVVGTLLRPDASGAVNTEAVTIRWTDFVQRAKFGAPDLGMRTVGPTVLYVYTRGERQWQRGYFPNLMRITDFNSSEASEKLGARFATTGNLSLASELVVPRNYMAPAELLKQLRLGARIGGAINSRLGVFTTGSCAHPVIAWRRNRVGWVDNEIHLHKDFLELANNLSNTLKMEVRVV